MITKIIYNNPKKIYGLSMEFQTSFESEKNVGDIFESYKDFFTTIKNKIYFTS
jgi:hypothetical protein